MRNPVRNVSFSYQRCLTALTRCFSSLQVKSSEEERNAIAHLIVDSMESENRIYHNLEHIFKVGEGGDAISMLASMFHDLVYYQIDQGFHLSLAKFITPLIQQKKNKLYLKEKLEISTPEISLVMDLFNFKPGNEITSGNGCNEFMSSIVAAQVLKPFLPMSTILKVVSCIELTIPFRMLNAPKQLEKKIHSLSQKHSLNLSDSETEETVLRAVRLANKDLSSFSNPSVLDFLMNTWEILPETNPLLRSTGNQTILGYRIALQKIEKFFRDLNPENVFLEYQEEPGPEVYAQWKKLLSKNIEIALYYFRFKLISLSILEAIAPALGKAIVLNILIGEIPRNTALNSQDQLEGFLPDLSVSLEQKAELEDEIVNVLRFGQTSSQAMDMQNSPLTAFLLNRIGFQKMQSLWSSTEAFFQNEIPAKELLKKIPYEVMSSFSEAIASVMSKKASLLSNFLKDVYKKEKNPSATQKPKSKKASAN